MKIDINWVIVAHQSMENDDAIVKHAVGYEEKPDEQTIISLIKELYRDEELGMAGLRFGTDYDLSVVAREDEHFKSILDQFGVPYYFDIDD